VSNKNTLIEQSLHLYDYYNSTATSIPLLPLAPPNSDPYIAPPTTTRIYLDISPTTGKYKKYSPVVPFDLRCQSGINYIPYIFKGKFVAIGHIASIRGKIFAVETCAPIKMDCWVHYSWKTLVIHEIRESLNPIYYTVSISNLPSQG